MISAEMAADNWPLMEKARCLTERAPSMGVHTHLVRKMCVQAAKRFGLKLASRVPATCGGPECFLSEPFRWCAQMGLALTAIFAVKASSSSVWVPEAQLVPLLSQGACCALSCVVI